MKLIWPIRRSFTDYVRASGGSIVLEGGVAETDDGFAFDGAAGSPLAFSGSVHFEAHDGLLDVTIGDPLIAIDGPGGTISVTTGTGVPRVTLARLVDIQEGDPRTAKVLLTFEGTRLLGDVYSPGSSLDPFWIADSDA